jgi:hypothetical protein
MAALTDKMRKALALLTRHSMVRVGSARPSGRHLGPSEVIHPATARALEQLGLAKVTFVGGRRDRDRGLNANYASITDAGRRVAG